MINLEKERLDKNISEKFSLDNNTLVRTVSADVRDRLELEIGDSKSDFFMPQAKFMRWDNECNFSIRRDVDVVDIVTRGDKVVVDSFDEEVVFYELPELDDGEGGFEIELHLKKKPKTNVFDFSLQTKGLVFHYQPALSQEEIDGGAERPENVVGSYAVYHESKRDNYSFSKDYKTGKFCHIYRPHVVDADGNETWGELNIEENVLSVIVPQEFLDNAVYPVVVDPTFGYTTAGGSSWGFNYESDGWWYGLFNRVTRPESGYMVSATARLNQRTGHSTAPSFRVCIVHTVFNLVEGTGVNNTLIRASSLGTIPSTSISWETTSFTNEYVLYSFDAHLGVQVQYGGYNLWFDTSSGQELSNVNYASLVSEYDTFTLFKDSATNRIYSLYVTYDVKPLIKLGGVFTGRTLKLKTGGSFDLTTTLVKSGGVFK